LRRKKGGNVGKELKPGERKNGAEYCRLKSDHYQEMRIKKAKKGAIIDG